MSTGADHGRPRGLGLLVAQTTALGLLAGFVIIPASGLFLAAHGARALPFVYLAVAVAAAAVDPLLTRALRRHAIGTVAVAVLAVEVLLIGATWVGLEASGASWLSVVLQVLFPILISVGFVLVGGQAGRLLTLREMKEHFPLVVAGFSLGFLAAGLLAPLLLELLGGTERLVAVTTLCAVVLLGLVVTTSARNREALRTVDVAPPSLDDRREAAGDARRGASFVVLLFGYQMLSALGTQLGDFLVYDRAAARYASSEDLARFVSVFSVILNVVTLLFVALVAGRLLARRGMRFGLMANPAVMTLFILVGAVGGASAGVASMLMFSALGAARVSDIALTDGMTRTSLNVAYQGLPAHLRAATQGRVEGLGVPLAIGFSGVVLLVVQRIFDGGPLAVALVAAAVCVAWCAFGHAVFQGYQDLLREALRRRTLVPGAEGAAATGVVERVALDDLRGLLDDAAAQPEHPARTRRAVRATRAARHDLTPDAVALLTANVGHPVREVGCAVVQALAHADPSLLALRRDVIVEVLRADAAHAARLLHALDVLDGAPHAAPLRAALRDEALLVRRRALAALGLTMSAPAVARAAVWLDSDDPRLVSSAVEALEVNAPAAVRTEALAVLTLPTDRPTARRAVGRLVRARRVPPLPGGGVAEVLADLAHDPDVRWRRPWLRTCAAHVAGTGASAALAAG